MNNPSKVIQSNSIRTLLLLIATFALVLAASYFLGTLLGDVPMGIAIGVIACVIVIPIQMLLTKFAILTLTRGRKANPSNHAEAALLRDIEILSLNAGLSRTPTLYITEASAPNAFASGLGEGSAFVCVTRGLLSTMSEEEICGVIGHELGHIKHGDIRLNTVVNGMTSVLMIFCFVIEWIGRGMIWGGERRRREKGGDAVLVGFVILLAVMLLRPLLSIITTLLQLAISRSREYAADAFAVEVNGSPRGIGDALESLARSEEEITSEQITELGGSKLASMYFSFPSASELFSMHPPLE